MRSSLPASPRVLDVGCGIGDLGVLLQRVLPAGAVMVSLEPMAERAAIARAKGLDVKADTVREFAARAANTASWDVVIMDNLLEHLLEPADAIAAARELLAPGGALVVGVPNVNEIRRFLPRQRRLSGKQYSMWTPAQHINYFSVGTLRKLLALRGFTSEFLQPNMVDAPLKWKVLWLAKRLTEKLVDYTPRGIYDVARIEPAGVPS